MLESMRTKVDSAFQSLQAQALVPFENERPGHVLFNTTQHKLNLD